MSAADALLLTLSMLAGLLLIFIGLTLLLSRKGGEARGVGFILIGPVPIILRGAGAKILVIVSAIFLAALLLALLMAGVVAHGL